MIKVLKSKTATQAFIYTLFNLLSRFISFLVLLYFARVVGAAHFGVYNYIVSVVYLFLPLSHLGMFGKILFLSKSKSPEIFESYLFTFIVLNLTTSLVVGAVVFLRGYSLLLSLATSMFLLSRATYDYLRKAHVAGLGRVRYVSMASLINRLTFSLLAVVLPKKTLFLMGSLILADFISSSFMLRRIRFKLKPKVRFDFFSWIFFLPVIFNSIAARLPQLIYEKRFGVVALGNFGVAVLIYQGLVFILNDISEFISQRGGAITKEGMKRLERLSFVSTFLIILSVIVMRNLISPFVRLLFGDKYLLSEQILYALFFGLGATTLIIYPRVFMIYRYPRGLSFVSLIYALSSIAAATIASNIVQATYLRVAAQYIYALSAWVIVWYSRKRAVEHF